MNMQELVNQVKGLSEICRYNVDGKCAKVGLVFDCEPFVCPAVNQ